MFILFDMYHPYYSLSYVARSYISKIDREILGFRNGHIKQFSVRIGKTYQCMQTFSTTFNHPWSQLIA